MKAGILLHFAALALAGAAQAASCSTDSLGITKCSDGSSLTVSPSGIVRDNKGQIWSTDSLGVTRSPDGTTFDRLPKVIPAPRVIAPGKTACPTPSVGVDTAGAGSGITRCY